MRIVSIADASDPRIRHFTDLTDVQLRQAREPAEGIFIAEGHNVIVRALAAGCEPVAALMEERWLIDLKSRLGEFDIDVCVADQTVLKAVTGFRLHRGALVAFRRYGLPSPAQILADSATIVVLENLVDHTNVGLIFRSAAALGADAVLVSPQCADPLYRRSVKVSMGAVFNVAWTRALPWPWILEDIRDAGFDLLALTPEPAAQPLSAYRRGKRTALMLGSEGPGLSQESIRRASHQLRIPMSNRVDSLNVAATAAVACYAIAESETR